MAARAVCSCSFPLARRRLLAAVPVSQKRLLNVTPCRQQRPAPTGLQAMLKEKTGVTGMWTLGVGLTATLLSKEIIIFHAETLVGLSIAGVIWYLMRRLGKPTAQYLDDRSQGILDKFNEDRNSVITSLEQSIAAQENVETILSCRQEVFEIMRENSAMEREVEYRRRLHDIATSVKRRLDYQAQLESLQRQFEQRQLVSWLENQVLQTVKSRPDDSLPQSVAALKKMAAGN